MKIAQDPAPFKPITITLENKAEADAFWGLVEAGGRASEERSVKGLSIKLSDWFSQSASL